MGLSPSLIYTFSKPLIKLWYFSTHDGKGSTYICKWAKPSKMIGNCSLHISTHFSFLNSNVHECTVIHRCSLDTHAYTKACMHHYGSLADTYSLNTIQLVHAVRTYEELKSFEIKCSSWFCLVVYLSLVHSFHSIFHLALTAMLQPIRMSL